MPASHMFEPVIHVRRAVRGLLLCLAFIFLALTCAEAANQHISPSGPPLQGSFQAPSLQSFRLARKSGQENRKHYEHMPQQEQERLQRRYEQWQRLSPQQKEILRRRQERWESMTPRERELYRQRYEQLQELPPDERREINEKLRNWKQLSPREREEIRQRFRNSP